jgi:hypothetical protein
LCVIVPKYIFIVTADSDEELDFLADMETTKQKRPRKGDDGDEQLGSDDDDDDDEDEDGEDEEVADAGGDDGGK